jgi:hypothetical protein
MLYERLLRFATNTAAIASAMAPNAALRRTPVLPAWSHARLVRPTTAMALAARPIASPSCVSAAADDGALNNV